MSGERCARCPHPRSRHSGDGCRLIDCDCEHYTAATDDRGGA